MEAKYSSQWGEVFQSILGFLSPLVSKLKNIYKDVKIEIKYSYEVSVTQ